MTGPTIVVYLNCGGFDVVNDEELSLLLDTACTTLMS